MEITIIKKVFLTEEVDDDLSLEQLQEKVNEIIAEHDDIEDWDEQDWRCKEVYEVYDTYSGETVLEFDK